MGGPRPPRGARTTLKGGAEKLAPGKFFFMGNKLDVKSDLSLALTQSIALQIDMIMMKKQSQLQVGD